MERFIFSSIARHCLHTSLVYSFGRAAAEEEGRGFPLGWESGEDRPAKQQVSVCVEEETCLSLQKQNLVLLSRK